MGWMACPRGQRLYMRTAALYKGTIAPALREQLGTVRLTDLTAGDVQAALTAMAARLSGAEVMDQIFG